MLKNSLKIGLLGMLVGAFFSLCAGPDDQKVFSGEVADDRNLAELCSDLFAYDYRIRHEKDESFKKDLEQTVNSLQKLIQSSEQSSEFVRNLINQLIVGSRKIVDNCMKWGRNLQESVERYRQQEFVRTQYYDGMY
jgi:hypothetical protein